MHSIVRLQQPLKLLSQITVVAALLVKKQHARVGPQFRCSGKE